MNEKYFLIMFSDGCFTISVNKPNTRDYQNNSKFFVVSGKMTMENLSELFAMNLYNLDIPENYIKLIEKI